MGEGHRVAHTSELSWANKTLIQNVSVFKKKKTCIIRLQISKGYVEITMGYVEIYNLP